MLRLEAAVKLQQHEVDWLGHQT